MKMRRLILASLLLLLGSCAADRQCGAFCHQGMPHMYVLGSGRYLGDGFCSCTFGPTGGVHYERLRVNMWRGRRYQEEDAK